jgi:hypothetical protein
MEKYNDGEFVVNITDDKFKIELPLKILVNAFNLHPDNFDEAIVKRGKQKEFAKLIAQNLLDSVDSEKGTNYIEDMLDKVFEEIFEGNIYAEEIINFKEEE